MLMGREHKSTMSWQRFNSEEGKACLLCVIRALNMYLCTAYVHVQQNVGVHTRNLCRMHKYRYGNVYMAYILFEIGKDGLNYYKFVQPLALPHQLRQLFEIGFPCR